MLFVEENEAAKGQEDADRDYPERRRAGNCGYNERQHGISYIGHSHLIADSDLGEFLAEDLRCILHRAGVHRCEAKSYETESDRTQDIGCGGNQKDNEADNTYDRSKPDGGLYRFCRQ